MRRLLPMLALAIAAKSLAAQRTDTTTSLERSLLRELVEINTSDSAGHTREAAEAMQRHLLAAGFPAADVQVIGEVPRYQSLVARYRGRTIGLRPILLMAHLDVVDARREDWSFAPYEFREIDGYYYGRGTRDNKFGAALLVANFLRYKSEAFVPDRDIILVLTADEETSGNAMQWLLDQHRALVDAEYALNTDAGSGVLRDGHAVAFMVQTAEKVHIPLHLEVRSRGGHASVPEPDNAIYRLSDGLARLARYSFPVRLNETTRAYFAAMATLERGAVAADLRALARAGDATAARRLSRVPYFNAQMRTTCVATQLLAGDAMNVLPLMARATVSCRLLPDDSYDSVQATLERVVADTAIRFTRFWPPYVSPISTLRSSVLQPMEQLVRQVWPEATLIPEMATGGTEGSMTRAAGIPTYGVAAVFEPTDGDRSHGRDERIGVRSYHDAAEFWYQLVKRLTSRIGT